MKDPVKPQKKRSSFVRFMIYFTASFFLSIGIILSIIPNAVTAQNDINPYSGLPFTSIMYTSPDAKHTSSIAWGDMDGDGDLDLAVGNYDVSVGEAHYELVPAVNQIYENDGFGRFLPSRNLESEAIDRNTRSIAWGDMDGDGDLDLAVGNEWTNQVYENDGRGNFSDPKQLEASSEWRETASIAWGDMDGDGDLDLAVGNGGTYNNSYPDPNQVYENDGTGNFSAPISLESEVDVKDTQSIAWGDMDGDGDLDLAVGNHDAPNQVYQNDGLGNFSAPVPLESESDAKDTNSIAWGDMDGDGDLDLAVGNFGINIVYENDGAGNFSLPIDLELAIDAKSTTSVAWGDMDGDGDLDLAAGNGGHDQIYENFGFGNFSPPTILELDADAKITSSIAWGDIDGDSDLDLAVGNASRTSTKAVNQIYKNNSTRNFSLPRRVNATMAAIDSYNLAVGDIDSDNDLDIIAGNDGENYVYENSGSGDFLPPRRIGSMDADNRSTRSIALGDVDGDNDLDIVNGNSWINQIYMNDGRGNFSDPMDLEMSDEAYPTYSLVLGDIDLDGDIDIVVGNGSNTSTNYVNQVYKNNGTGNFSVPIELESAIDARNTQAIALGDMDSDGDLDLAVGNTDSNQIYENDGLGNFSLLPNLDSETDVQYTKSIAWGDMDGDGDLDLIAGGTESSQIYENDGSGDFSTSVNQDTINGNIITLGDLDNDGDLDIVSATRSNLEIHYNNGLISFSTTTLPHPVRGGTIMENILLEDIDGDLDLDLGVATTRFDTDYFDYKPNLLYKNDGVGNFLAPLELENATTVVERRTQSIAWGDMDNDGDLDLASGNIDSSHIYENSGAGNFSVPIVLDGDNADVIVWADINGDGSLDITTANNETVRAYKNDGTGSFSTPQELIPENFTDSLSSIAWGDMDGDGDLDLAIGNNGSRNLVFENDGLGNLFAERFIGNSDNGIKTQSIVWGDMDSDGDLDLAIGNYSSTNQVFENDGLGNFTLFWALDLIIDVRQTNSIAWGDMDGDGDLDLAVGNSETNQVYENDGFGRFSTPRDIESSFSLRNTNSIAWGDIDGDGDLDLAAGNSDFRYPNRFLHPNNNQIYENDGLGNFAPPRDLDRSWYETNSIAWGDMDGDGDLDLAAGNTNLGSPVDGQNVYPQNMIYENHHQRTSTQLPALAILEIAGRKVSQHNGAYSLTDIIAQESIPIKYRIDAPLSVSIAELQVEYATGTINETGKRWRSAIAISDTITQNLPVGTHTFYWDAFASGFFGQSDNVMIRLVAYPQATQPANIVGRHQYINAVANSFQRPYVSTSTLPFRMRGTQVQVCLVSCIDNNSGLAKAVVYRLNHNQARDGIVMGAITRSEEQRAAAFNTNGVGYLNGSGKLTNGDQLLALASPPEDWWTLSPWLQNPYTYTQNLTDTIKLYYTNGEPIEEGVKTTIKNGSSGIISNTVTGFGVQQLEVSADNPLLLFDLNVALEWDASTDPNRAYLNQLETDIQKASEYIYDFTNGQAALGHITVTQNAENWAIADVIIQATNRLRPYAVQGGIVLTPTVDAQNPDVVYETGHVRMGASWNRYGNPGQSLGEDWPLTLAHELAHYLFFLEDTYLGVREVDGQSILVPIDACEGSVMGDMYDPSGENTEFLTDEQWSACNETLANVTLGRSEWATIKQFYPMLKAPDERNFYNPGPARMPFNLTEIMVLDPTIETVNDEPIVTLADTIFFLDYAGNVPSSASARAYLLKKNFNGGETFLIDLGTPEGGQNRLLVRGASVGDRLCIVDPQKAHFGCEEISETRERVRLSQDASWQPDIRVTPVTSSTIKIDVANVGNIDTPIKVRVFQELIEASPELELVDDGTGILSTIYTATATITTTIDNITQTIDINVPLMVGHIQLWVDETDSTAQARRETFVDFRVGGNPGSGPAFRWSGPAFRWSGPAFRWSGPAFRWSGPAFRWSGPAFRWSGTSQRNRSAPVVSADGQMIFFTDEFDEFEVGDLYTVQSSSVSNDLLPANKQAIGLGYRLVGSASLRQRVIPGSISFQYLGTDTLGVGITEEEEETLLQIHYYDETLGLWRALNTIADADYNFASAASQGDGLYVLLAGKSQPVVESMSDAWLQSGASAVITLTGQHFLPPAQIMLTDTDGITMTLAATVSRTDAFTVAIPSDLLPQAYQISLINGDKIVAPVAAELSMLPPLQANECFADRFESGSGQWQRTGQWDVVELPDGRGYAITDSPAGNYNSAPPNEDRLVTWITSPAFNLANCPDAALTFRHAYGIASEEGVHQDSADVLISTDGGATWLSLLETPYHSQVVQEVEAADLGIEWLNTSLEEVVLPLSAYAEADSLHLRFQLSVDQRWADKGWILDDISVRTADTVPEPTPPTACGALEQEAEAGTIAGAFTIGTQANASGGQYIHVPADSVPGAWAGPDGVNYAGYCVTVTEAGRYRILAISASANNSRNSFYVQVNGQPATGNLWEAPIGDGFIESYIGDSGGMNPVEIDLSVGDHTILFSLRETGTQLDKFVLERVDSDRPITNCGPLQQEAEAGTLSGGFVVADDNRASGGKFVHVADGANEYNGPNSLRKTEYCFNVTEAGAYAINATVDGLDNGSNSFYVRVDDAPAAGYKWHMSIDEGYVYDYVSDAVGVDPVVVALTPGEHKVTVYLRERNTRLDTIALERQDSPPPQASCGPLQQEAEEGALSGGFVTGNDEAASDGQFIHVPNGSGDEYDGYNTLRKAEYCFIVDTAGDYVIKTNVYGTNNGDNSFYVRVNDGPAAGYKWHSLVNSSYAEDYVSTAGIADPVVVALTPGEHKVSVYLREDGTRLDTIALEPAAAVVAATDTVAPSVAEGVYGHIQLQASVTGRSVNPDSVEFSQFSIQLDDADADGVSYLTTLNAAGAYRFDDLPIGDYRLSLIPPTGYTSLMPANVPITLSDQQIRRVVPDVVKLEMEQFIYLPSMFE